MKKLVGPEASQESDKALEYAAQATEEEMVPGHQNQEGLGGPPQCSSGARVHMSRGQGRRAGHRG